MTYTPIPDPEKARAALKEKLAQRLAVPPVTPAPEPRGQFIKVKIEDAPEFEKRTGFTFRRMEEHPIHGPVFVGTFEGA